MKSWNGAIDRQAVAAQQQPAPKPVRSAVPSHAALLALFQAQPRRHWTHAELTRAMKRDRTTVGFEPVAVDLGMAAVTRPARQEAQSWASCE